MRKRDIVGKRIIDVHQTAFYNAETDRTETEFTSMELDDGTAVLLWAKETGGCPAVGTTVVRRSPRVRNAAAIAAELAAGGVSDETIEAMMADLIRLPEYRRKQLAARLILSTLTDVSARNARDASARDTEALR